MLSHAIVLASSMFDVSSRAKLSVSALAERKIASARPRKYGLLLRAEEEMLLYGQALISYAARLSAETTLSCVDLRAAGIQLVIHASGGLLVLLVPAVLSVYKPPGMTRYGWRKQHA